jgi:hypothetical protein
MRSISWSLSFWNSFARARFADLLMASTAAANNLPLYTRNPDDFQDLLGWPWRINPMVAGRFARGLPLLGPHFPVLLEEPAVAAVAFSSGYSLWLFGRHRIEGHDDALVVGPYH